MHAGATAQAGMAALIRTKLDLPPLRTHLLPRERLCALVPALPDMRLVLLSAPAGFGKTSFLSLWCHALAARQGAAIAWLALDERDNEPARFLAYLSAAVAHALGLDLTDELLLTRSGAGSASAEAVLSQIINDLAQQCRDVVLVLDDYHLICEPAVHAAVAFLLEHMPAHSHLAIGSRTDPPLALARLRARDQLVELRAADLRFSQDEVEAFFAAHRPPLSPEQIRAISMDVEGWPAGIQLIALAIRSAARQDTDAHQASAEALAHIAAGRLDGSHKLLFAYFAEDVLAHQPPHLKAFLLQTSVADRLCGPLCDAILGVSDQAPLEGGHMTGLEGGANRLAQDDSYSRLILDELDHANLFVMPLDHERHWYRYHHLFRAFLRDQLDHEPPAIVAGLHLRASAWYERNQMLPQAVEHALAARAFDRAAELVDASAQAVVARSECATLHSWLEQFPEVTISARPSLSLWAAWDALLTGAVERVGPALDRAICGWQATGDTARLAEAAHLLAHLARLRHDPIQAIAAAERAISDLPPDAAALRAGSLIALGAGQLQAGALSAAAATLTDAAALCRAHTDLGQLIALRYLGDLAVRQGQLHTAESRYREVLQAVRGRELCERCSAAIGLGDIARERNQLGEAEQQLRAALAAAERAGVATYHLAGFIALARTIGALGDHAGADAILGQALTAARQLGSPAYTRQVSAFRARLALARGELSAANTWHAERPPHCEHECDDTSRIEALTLARLLIAQGRLDSSHRPLAAAQALLKRVQQEADSHGQGATLIEALLLTAIADSAIGRRDLALRAIEQAVALAEPEGYARIFIDEGEPITELLIAYRAQRVRQERREGRAPSSVDAYLSFLLGALRRDSSAQGPPTTDDSMAACAEALSLREVEVLRLIADGASNQTIADRLVISIGTVKSHISHILGKLAARSRTEAVARARDRGLLANL